MDILSAMKRVSRRAESQCGRIAWYQLAEFGVDKKKIGRWQQDGYLRRVLPRVYAVGHVAPSVESDLAAALLYAGPGAMLSHGTAAWWWGLVEKPPPVINVSTSRRCRSLPGIKVHQRRTCERGWHKGLPVTSVAETLLDYAVVAALNRVRVAMANAEYHNRLDIAEVQAMDGRGRAGTTKLREALKRHAPGLAHTRSPKEVAFFLLCEKYGLPIPEVNVRVAGWAVDFFWRREGVVVEVDPPGNHHTPAQIDRDHRKDLALRAARLVVHRYSREQVERAHDAIAADVVAAVERRRSA